MKKTNPKKIQHTDSNESDSKPLREAIGLVLEEAKNVVRQLVKPQQVSAKAYP